MLVVPRAICVLTSVDFHDQVAFQTCEIRNVATNGKLPTEFETIEITIAQAPPEKRLGVGGRGAQPSRMFGALSRFQTPPSPAPSARPLPPAGEADQCVTHPRILTTG